MPRVYKRIVPTCHPERCHGGYGLCKSCYHRKYRPADYNLKYKLRSQYGLTVDQFHAMIAAQDNKCPICLQPPDTSSKWTRRLVVDHDHVTGEVRGLLCHTCNRMLAWIENQGWMERAQAYLKQPKKRAA